MNPRSRALPIRVLADGQAPPRAPRGFARVSIAHTVHMARRASGLTLCHRRVDERDRYRPLAVCLTCAAAIAELS